jgi:succinyl-CoA synthetase beta subunit
MNLHEYQAKTLLQKYGIPVPRGQVISMAKETAAATSEIQASAWVVKAQVHAGGRGKAGGVKVVNSNAEAQAVANELLGKTLVTYQNAPDGQPVNQLLIEETLPIARELYLSMLVDRGLERVVIVASVAGGMDIEEIAAKTPEKVLQEVCDPLNGLVDVYQIGQRHVQII